MDTFELAPGIVLRKVTAADIEHWVNHDWLEVIHKQPIAEPQLLVLDCLADITCHPATVGIIDAFQEEEDLCHRVVTALRLALDGDIQPAFWEGWRSGTLNVMQSAGVHPALRALSRPSPLDEQSGEVLKRIWDQLRTAPTATVAELAVRRWDDAAERRREDDRLVDYWVGLESLFSPDSNSEVRFRASYRIAAYLGNTGDERLEIYKFMRDSYDCRSAIVHGARSNKKLTEVPSYEERTRRYLRTAILKVLGAASFDPTVIERDLLAKNGATDEDSRI